MKNLNFVGTCGRSSNQVFLVGGALIGAGGHSSGLYFWEDSFVHYWTKETMRSKIWKYMEGKDVEVAIPSIKTKEAIKKELEGIASKRGWQWATAKDWCEEHLEEGGREVLLLHQGECTSHMKEVSRAGATLQTILRDNQKYMP